MTPEEFERQMHEIFDRGDRIIDTADSHSQGDELMCRLLRSLGYHAGVEVFEKAPKWYD
jgi:hypothetical protein